MQRTKRVCSTVNEAIAEWVRLAFAWLFLTTVLVSGLAAFGVILVSVGLCRVITTTYGRVKKFLKSAVRFPDGSST